ncbi:MULTISPECIES: hypothetical protein [Chryseobacterium]|uniref:hypothetical protein n=1 Tax=Chryseobacterium TaxID=59732 RepID=UPI00195743A1|nr:MULTISPECIES: hypothetical protein [Chryseobacterium]MBM7421650.1 putative membrane protein [Chryseobacterium sp. JUb44]MDH6211618.1 putative membrane protein [Chryseobacterium sp. BIGb0186]WSO10260.1 hypothetical protein VUJ64_20950 [Chryseobacterium scophthalmum]
MQLGRLFGILAIFCGGIFTYLGYGMMETTGSVFKFVLAAPVFVLIGIAMLVFPGGDITTTESKNKTKDPKVWVSDAPKNHKIAWAIAGVIGFIISITVFKI